MKRVKRFFQNLVIDIITWSAIVTGVLAGLGAAGVGPFSSNAGKGIHPIGGGDAAYIAGEVCVVNAPLERSVTDMHTDFQKCVELHTKYQEGGGE